MFSLRKKLISPKLEEIKCHLATNDEWSYVIEWGVGKETFVLISKSKTDASWYDVAVELDHKFHCQCPTVDRAVEFAEIYADLIHKLYMSNGWPSWHSRNAL